MLRKIMALSFEEFGLWDNEAEQLRHAGLWPELLENAAFNDTRVYQYLDDLDQITRHIDTLKAKAAPLTPEARSAHLLLAIRSNDLLQVLALLSMGTRIDPKTLIPHLSTVSPIIQEALIIHAVRQNTRWLDYFIHHSVAAKDFKTLELIYGEMERSIVQKNLNATADEWLFSRVMALTDRSDKDSELTLSRKLYNFFVSRLNAQQVPHDLFSERIPGDGVSKNHRKSVLTELFWRRNIAAAYTRGDVFYGVSEDRERYTSRLPENVHYINTDQYNMDFLAGGYEGDTTYTPYTPGLPGNVQRFKRFLEHHKKYDPRKIPGPDQQDLRIARACKGGLEHFNKVHFVLDSLNDIPAIFNKSGTYGQSFTAKELRKAHRLFSRNPAYYTLRILFWKDGHRVAPPW